VLRFLERIASHVRDQWRTKFDERLAPYTELLATVFLADSTDRRNTGVKSFGWCFVV
jgi:hypothetical protein